MIRACDEDFRENCGMSNIFPLPLPLSNNVQMSCEQRSPIRIWVSQVPTYSGIDRTETVLVHNVHDQNVMPLSLFLSPYLLAIF